MADKNAKAIVKALTESELRQAQQSMMEILQHGVGTPFNKASLTARLMQCGIIGLDVEKFCKAQTDDERMQCFDGTFDHTKG